VAHFEHSSVIAAPRKKVFDFMADITNLPLVMPPHYRVEMTSPTPKMKKGSEYEIRISRYGISALWGTVIEDFVPGEMFRDRQSYGPFSLWVHTHKFEDHGQGTLLTDLIEYDLSFGLLGKIAQDLFVRRDLQKVFEYRHTKMQELLAEPTKKSSSK
jgi:ligand-binding SRPBCC domain-containing protein